MSDASDCRQPAQVLTKWQQHEVAQKGWSSSMDTSKSRGDDANARETSKNCDNQEDVPRSHFQRLPPELKQLIHELYFREQHSTFDVVYNPLTKQEQITGNTKAVSGILLTCRDILETGLPYIRLASNIVDFRQYYPPPRAELDVASVVAKPRFATSSCQIIMRSDQCSTPGDKNSVPKPLPNLRQVTCWSYSGFQESLLALTNRGQVFGAGFEATTKRLLRPEAARLLQSLKSQFPGAQDIEGIYTCDCLICTPSYSMYRWSGKSRKLRHLFKFSDEHPDGVMLSQEWSQTGVCLGTGSVNDYRAVHLHTYCEELRDQPEDQP